METNIPNQGNATFEGQRDLPGASAVLVLGILSIVLMGIIGLILGIIALSKAKECKYNYDLNPSAYSLSSYKNMRGGRVCAIVSMSILGGLLFIVIVAVATGAMM